MKIGGPKSITDVIKNNGGEVGPRSVWAGAWMLNSGYGGLEKFYAECKADGVQPLVLVWIIGDDDGSKFLTTGVTDMYQNVFKDRAIGLKMTVEITRRAKAAGVTPIFILNNEFNKHGLDQSADFASFYDEQVAIVRRECPGAKVCFAPGAWGDHVALSKFYAKQVAASDLVGTQAGFFAPRVNHTNIGGIGPGLAQKFAVWGDKPKILYDVFFSCYGGAYAKTHPFAGGDGRALEKQQAEGIASLAKIPDLTAIVYRDLKDNPTFDVKNYGGYAERFVGLMRTDGTPKPSLAELIKLSKTSTPTEPTPMPTTVKFTPKVGNQYWTEVFVDPLPSSVVAVINGGAPVQMTKTNWNSFASKAKVPSGAKIQFTAAFSDDTKATSPTYTAYGMTVVSEPTPTPKTYTQEEMDAVNAELKSAQAQIADLNEKVRTLTNDVNALTAKFDQVRAILQ